ncbi:MAG: SagB/ThcOx family dehydrogenase [Verrucomicrobia bacterium]|nr:MAG: SagB/ThcOx family dehydrogenase [Verrucomicrobiota bacterium]
MTIKTIKLPEPKTDGPISVAKALYLRRSTREFRNEPLAIGEVAQLVWATQGVTALGGYRTAPSAGALYPLELYVVVGQVRDVAPGVYRYKPAEHTLVKVIEHDVRRDLGEAAWEQTWLQNAAVLLVLTARPERTTGKYGARGLRFIHMEAGHAAQNLALEAVALGLGSVAVSAFDDERVRRILALKGNEEPLYLLPVGKK